MVQLSHSLLYKFYPDIEKILTKTFLEYCLDDAHLDVKYYKTLREKNVGKKTNYFLLGKSDKFYILSIS